MRGLLTLATGALPAGVVVVDYATPRPSRWPGRGYATARKAIAARKRRRAQRLARRITRHHR